MEKAAAPARRPRDTSPKPWDPFWSFHNLCLQLGVLSFWVYWLSSRNIYATLAFAVPSLLFGLLARVRAEGHPGVRKATLIGMSLALLAVVLIIARAWR